MRPVIRASPAGSEESFTYGEALALQYLPPQHCIPHTVEGWHETAKLLNRDYPVSNVLDSLGREFVFDKVTWRPGKVEITSWRVEYQDFQQYQPSVLSKKIGVRFSVILLIDFMKMITGFPPHSDSAMPVTLAEPKVWLVNLMHFLSS